MIKTFYEAPLVKVLEVRTGSIFLASGERMNVKTGSWDEETPESGV